MNNQMIENKVLEAIKLIDSVYDSEDNWEWIEKIKKHISKLENKQKTKDIKEQILDLYKDNPELKQIIDGIEFSDRSESHEGYFTYHECVINSGTGLGFKNKTKVSGEVVLFNELFYNVDNDGWIKMSFHKDDQDGTMIDNKSLNYLYNFLGLKITKKSEFREFLSNIFDEMK